MTLDHNLFTQMGIDSGSLTMLGAVVHSLGGPGEYRGTVRKEGEGQAVFYISVDKNSPVAQIDIDLAALTHTAPELPDKDCGCEGEKNRFSVNPRGYALFRVSGGPGGYNVHLRKAVEAEDTKIFDSRKLSDGAIFSATILRPGTYTAANLLGPGKAKIVVSYPQRGKTAYRPPAPVRVLATEKGFYPERIKLKPAQGLLFECKSLSRIKIELVEPDDGPSRAAKPPAPKKASRGKKRRA
jgi:hypothetical protein